MLVVLFAALVLFVVGVVAIDRHKQKKIDHAWWQLAQQIGGQLELGQGYGLLPRGGIGRPFKPRLISQSPHFPGMVIDHFNYAGAANERLAERLAAFSGSASREMNGNSTTRLQNTVVGSIGLQLLVYRKKTMHRLAEAVGFQDVPTGDAQFDDAFVVKCNEPERARIWLTEPVRQALLALDGYRFEVREGRLRAIRDAIDTDVARLLMAAQTMMLFARAGEELYAQWLAFAESNHGEGQGNLDSFDLQRNGIAIRVHHGEEKAGFGLSERAAFTELRAKRVGVSRERFVLAEGLETDALQPVRLEGMPTRYRIASSEPGDTARRFAPHLMKRLDALAPSYVRSDGDWVTMRIEGIGFDADRMDEAVDMLAELAQSADKDAYRS